MAQLLLPRLKITGVTEAGLPDNDKAQASLIGAVAASSGVGSSLVSLTKIGDTLNDRRRLESEGLTLTFELKTGSVEAAKSLIQKVESTTFASSVTALLAGREIEVATDDPWPVVPLDGIPCCIEYGFVPCG